ncbi:hypothetical protein NQ318_008308 [Aromia moschata]|uniref:Uncharacterized protein n=1 Tax=Aromia moschata TaxID=1265417 RepID=A0AAV8Y6L1_9CUCU|nr:hypothetical protein NQ318_008308 [Aromia moschata]
MFVTGSAATMHVVGRSLQEHGCNIHVTCNVHALHLVANTIMVDALIASTKKVFLKPPERRAFHSRCSNIPEPPQPATDSYTLRGHGWRQLFIMLNILNK